MNDDARLKFVFYSIIILSVVAIVGIWENFVEPFIGFLTNLIVFI